jgi:hypothetical protein
VLRQGQAARDGRLAGLGRGGHGGSQLILSPSMIRSPSASEGPPRPGGPGRDLNPGFTIGALQDNRLIRLTRGGGSVPPEKPKERHGRDI